jgi:hypothetical protein
MTDQFPQLDLGECWGEPQFEIEAEVVTATVEKGMIVELTHVAAGVPKVSPADSGSLVAWGVVMDLKGGDGTVGTKVIVGKGGLFKVKAGSPGCTAGKVLEVVLESDETKGAVGDSTTASKVVGKAFQTGAQDEPVLAWIN